MGLVSMKGIILAQGMLEISKIIVYQLGEGQLLMLKIVKKSRIVKIIVDSSRQFLEIYQLIPQ